MEQQKTKKKRSQAQIDNQFKKGNPGGPGRPKTSNEIREMMAQASEGNLKLLLKAVKKGNRTAMQIYWDRVCAALPRQVEVKHSGNIGDGSIDESKLTEEELRALSEIKKKLNEPAPSQS